MFPLACMVSRTQCLGGKVKLFQQYHISQKTKHSPAAQMTSPHVGRYGATFDCSSLVRTTSGARFQVGVRLHVGKSVSSIVFNIVATCCKLFYLQAAPEEVQERLVGTTRQHNPTEVVTGACGAKFRSPELDDEELRACRCPTGRRVATSARRGCVGTLAAVLARLRCNGGGLQGNRLKRPTSKSRIWTV